MSARLTVPTVQDFAAVRDTASLREAAIEANRGNGSLIREGRVIVWRRDDPSPRRFDFTFQTPQLAAAALANAKAAVMQGGVS